MKKLITLLFLAFSISAYAQPDGDTFPDFTVTDIDGVTHNLQDYLDDGKIVVIDVFATWCSICINALPALEDIEDEYGVDGDDSVVILSFEKDPNTSNEATFATTYGVTHPIIANATDVISTWNTIYQPNFFVICTDGSFDYHSQVCSNSNLTNMIEDCQSIVSSVAEIDELEVRIINNPVISELWFEVNNTSGVEYSIVDLSGKTLRKDVSLDQRVSVELSDLESGIYLLQLRSGNSSFVTKRFIKQ